MEELIELLDKEEILEVEDKIEKALQKDKEAKDVLKEKEPKHTSSNADPKSGVPKSSNTEKTKDVNEMPSSTTHPPKMDTKSSIISPGPSIDKKKDEDTKRL